MIKVEREWKVMGQDLKYGKMKKKFIGGVNMSVKGVGNGSYYIIKR